MDSSSNFRIYGPYDVRPKVPFVCVGEDMTKQSFKDDCDINVLLKRYQETGLLDGVRDAAPQYLDATTLDFQEAQFLVAQAHSVFAALPSQVRERFDNDPASLLQFVHDPANLEESIALGFVDPDRVPDVLRGKPADPVAPGPAVVPSET
jgi:phage internal scaffolding protein